MTRQNTIDYCIHETNVSEIEQIQTIVDPKVYEDVGEDEKVQQQLQDFLQLALSSTQDEIERRPCMTDVARELVRIDKI